MNCLHVGHLLRGECFDAVYGPFEFRLPLGNDMLFGQQFCIETSLECSLYCKIVSSAALFFWSISNILLQFKVTIYANFGICDICNTPLQGFSCFAGGWQQLYRRTSIFNWYLSSGNCTPHNCITLCEIVSRSIKTLLHRVMLTFNVHVSSFIWHLHWPAVPCTCSFSTLLY